MVDYSKAPVQGEPAAHTAARKQAIKDAADKAATARKAALKRNANSNSAAHDAAIEAARKEANEGFKLMNDGARAVGMAQQRIAHALIMLDKEEAFPKRANFAKWHSHSPQQARDMIADMRNFLIGDAPKRPKKGEEAPKNLADMEAQYKAKRTAVERAVKLAAALLSIPVTKTAKPATFDDKRGWSVPIAALCPKGATPFDPAITVPLNNAGYHVKGTNGGLMPIRCSADQMITAYQSRQNKTSATTSAGAGKGANENNTTRDKKSTFVLSTALVAADPTPLLGVWHELVSIYREKSLATLDKTVVSNLQRLNVEIGAFLQERARVLKAVNDLPTTDAGRAALVKGNAAKAEEAKASA